MYIPYEGLVTFSLNPYAINVCLPYPPGDRLFPLNQHSTLQSPWPVPKSNGLPVPVAAGTVK